MLSYDIGKSDFYIRPVILLKSVINLISDLNAYSGQEGPQISNPGGYSKKTVPLFLDSANFLLI